MSYGTKNLYKVWCVLALSSLLACKSVSTIAAPYDNSVKARVALAQHLLGQGHVLDARRIIMPFCHRPNTTAQMYCVLAQSYINDPEQDPKMNAEVLDDLRLAIKIDPEHGEAYRLMAAFYNIQGNYADALKYEDKAIKAKDPDWGVLKLKTGTYASMGRYQDALDTINIFIARGGASDRTYFTKASLLEQLKRYDEAAATYRLSLSERNQDTTIFQLARCLERAGKYQDAIAVMTKLIKTNTSDGEAFALRARLEIKNKNPKMALDDFTQAIELEPIAKLYEERAAVFTQLGQPAAAAKDIARSKDLQDHPY